MGEESTYGHSAVLLAETIDALNIKSDGKYIDATFGRGGHSQAILKRLGKNGRLVALDKDPEAVAHASSIVASDNRFSIEHCAFQDIRQVVEGCDWIAQVDGLLMDLGVSSPQLDNPERGFSFQMDGALDMRMDPSTGISAADWVATASESELAGVFKEYGEEKFSKRIAKAIVKDRSQMPITRTRRLAEIIAAANPAWEKHKNPATRCFQAIRIYINQELHELKNCLDNVVDVLANHGRLVVISFHSGEDRMVKRFINKQVRGDKYPASLPVTQDMLNPSFRRIGKPIRASDQEIANNVRARSAILRVAERLPRRQLGREL
ncbi:MAG: 16S rRNA (cytosine(1402)-N(4))-methyltransferase RsmH [Thiohalomonadales bacterium]